MILPKSPPLPSPRLLLEFFLRARNARITRREEQSRRPQWFLLCGQASKEWLLNPQPASLRKLLPPPDRTWADPFLWKQGNDWFIFCEEWIFSRPHGHIAVLRVPPDGQTVSAAQPVLEEAHHLSYPFLFEYDGTLHMMPEGGHGGNIVAYECEEFPGRWRKKVTLMRDIHYADATILNHEGKWWLFVTIKQGIYGLNRDLFLFWADTPLTDRWTPHPHNPVVRGFSSARPAGRVFDLGGRLFRPSQNCLIRYGYGLNINQIVALDTEHYKEQRVTEVKPDWETAIRATHHIDWRDGRVVMDAQRLLPDPDQHPEGGHGTDRPH